MTDSGAAVTSTHSASSDAVCSPVIQVTDAAVVLGGQVIWEHVSLDVRPGEFLAILGPNGAGKSTLLKAILGLLPLTSGSISVLGMPARRGNSAIGYVPQRRHFDADIRIRGRDIVRLGVDGNPWGRLSRSSQVASDVIACGRSSNWLGQRHMPTGPSASYRAASSSGC